MLNVTGFVAGAVAYATPWVRWRVKRLWSPCKSFICKAVGVEAGTLKQDISCFEGIDHASKHIHFTGQS